MIVENMAMIYFLALITCKLIFLKVTSESWKMLSLISIGVANEAFSSDVDRKK